MDWTERSNKRGELWIGHAVGDLVATVEPVQAVLMIGETIYTRHWQIVKGGQGPKGVTIAQGYGRTTEDACLCCEDVLMRLGLSMVTLPPAFVEAVGELRNTYLPATPLMTLPDGEVNRGYPDDQIRELYRRAVGGCSASRWALEVIRRLDRQLDAAGAKLQAIQDTLDSGGE